ncbi:MAG TPA: sigma-70 family RNA polymerase sigma factor [Pseudonocardiaceae bacterium]|nr:sigma-70 family RNA polymerase sigma factor [Pseudonocardiaceae bacterium]
MSQPLTDRNTGGRACLAERVELAAAARGERWAFESLVRAHTSRMYRVALRIVGDPLEAQDVVQDAWIAVWRGLPGYRGEASAATWLHRVVTNAALDRLRARKATVTLEQFEEWREPVDPAPGPETSALRRDEATQLRRVLGALGPSHRVVVVLREFEGLSYQELAEVLEITTAAVRSRLHRGRAALLAAFADHGVSRSGSAPR